MLTQIRSLDLLHVLLNHLESICWVVRDLDRCASDLEVIEGDARHPRIPPPRPLKFSAFLQRSRDPVARPPRPTPSDPLLSTPHAKSSPIVSSCAPVSALWRRFPMHKPVFPSTPLPRCATGASPAPQKLQLEEILTLGSVAGLCSARTNCTQMPQQLLCGGMMGPTDGMLAKFLSRQMPLPRLPSIRIRKIRISFISVRTLKTL
jgi:hypothetical protein